MAASPTTPPAQPTSLPGIVGTWYGKTNGSFYLFNADGTWNWDERLANIKSQPENQGKWWLENGILKIQDLSGKDPCPASQIGSYQLAVSDQTLTLTLVTDACTVRAKQTTGPYSFIP